MILLLYFLAVAGSTKHCPLNRILSQLSKHVNHHRALPADIAIQSTSVDGQSLDLDQTGARTTCPTALHTKEGEASHIDLVLQLTEYALRSTAHSTFVALTPHTTSPDMMTHTPSQKSCNETILFECSLFCLQDHSYLISFLSQLEAALISASSQTCSTDHTRKSVLKLVISSLTRLSSIVQGKDPCPSNILCAMISACSATLTTVAGCSHVLRVDCEEGTEQLRDCMTSIEQIIVTLLKISKSRIGCGSRRDHVGSIREGHTNRMPGNNHPSQTGPFSSSSYFMDHSSSLGANSDITRNDNSSSSSDHRKSDHDDQHSEIDELQHSFIRLCLVILTSHDRKNVQNICGHSNLMNTLTQNGCLDDIVYVILRSLLSSCLVRETLGLIGSITPEATSCGNDRDRGGSDMMTSSVSVCPSSVYTFYDLRPLITALLSDCEGLRDIVLQQLFHPINLEAVRLIMHRTETSPFFAEYSGCDTTSDGLRCSDSSVSPFYSLLAKLAQSGSAYSDSVLTLCIYGWVPLERLYLKIEDLLALEVKSGSTGIRSAEKPQWIGDPIIYKDVAAKVLAYASVTGGLDGLQFEGISGLLIDLLYNSLHDDNVCYKVRDHILLLNNAASVKSMEVAGASADESDEELDLSMYFFSPIARTVDSSDAPIESDVSSSLTAEGRAETIVQTGDSRREAESGGWDETSILLATLQYRISHLSATTPRSPVALPLSVTPNTEEELQSLLLFVSMTACSSTDFDISPSAHS